jgi:hypothetical protein
VFDTVAGLPVHALVVHAVVVLLPLMALATIAVAARSGWRGLARYVVAANVLVLAMAFVARQSGEKLQARLVGLSNAPVAEDHEKYGKQLWLFALFLVVAAALVLLAVDRPALGPVVLVVAVVAGLSAIGWTVLTGDSGARAVWESTIENTQAP